MTWEVNIITDIVQAYWWLLLYTKCQQMFSLAFFIYSLPTHNTFVSMFANAIFPLCLHQSAHTCPAQGAASSVPWAQIMSDMSVVWPDKTDQLNSEWLDLSEPWALLKTADTGNLLCMHICFNTHTTAPIYSTVRLENHHINVTMTMRSFSLDPEGGELISVIQRDD